MPETYLSDTHIAERYGVHRSWPWRRAKLDPSFPQPVTLTPGCTRWKLSALESWEASKNNPQDAA